MRLKSVDFFAFPIDFERVGLSFEQLESGFDSEKWNPLVVKAPKISDAR